MSSKIFVGFKAFNLWPLRELMIDNLWTLVNDDTLEKGDFSKISRSQIPLCDSM